jgi:hypothetical protein
MDQGGIDKDMLYEIMPELQGIILEEMSKSEASKLIEALIAYMKIIGDQESMDR